MGLLSCNSFNFSVRISIHPPREGWDRSIITVSSAHPSFQSTHPVRGGTEICAANTTDLAISIHPPREGWDAKKILLGGIANISIHPPREGWDFSAASAFFACSSFQSTHPVRGGTRRRVRHSSGLPKFQSTHPVRGGTRFNQLFQCGGWHFNPPTP